MGSELKDAKARKAALDPTVSYCVTAPAGSGKTELLTQRFLTLLARVANPEEILAITFTRKAVAEMRARILTALRDAKQGSTSTAAHRQVTLVLARAVLQRDLQRNWQLLANPGRLRIFTFDAFGAYLVRQMPITSGSGGALNQEENAERLYRHAINHLFARLDDNSALAADISTVVSHLDCKLWQLETLLIDLLRKRDQWRSLYSSLQEGAAAQRLQDYLRFSVQELLGELRARLANFATPLCAHLNYAACKLQEQDKPSQLRELAGITSLPEADIAAVAVWRGIKALLLTEKTEWRKTVNVRQGFPARNAGEKSQKADFIQLLGELRLQPGVIELLAEISELPEHTYAEENWSLLEALLNVLRHSLAYLELAFQSSQKVDFSAVSLRALDALGELEAPSELALRLDYQIQHILVDEFQDTSRVQYELLARLTAEWATDVQANKTLFIVGDAMQSIYAFRNARVGLFMFARTHGMAGLPLQPLELSTNFRSGQTIVEWVNSTFAAAFPAVDDLRLGATRYVASAALNSVDSAAVQTFAYFDTQSKHAEAEKICDLITATCVREPHSSIAILLRTRKQAEHILPALRNAGITWQAAELDKLSDQPCVTDLMSITRALLNPADRVAWLALLRLPVCGLSMADLLAVAGAAPDNATPVLLERLTDYKSIGGLSKDGKVRLALLSEVFGTAWKTRQRKPLHFVVRGLWQALSGDCVYPSIAEQNYSERYLQVLEQTEQSGEPLSWQLVEENIERQYAEPVGDADATLQIMTIHKAKGLEFNTVFLPSLHQNVQGDRTELLTWFDPVNADGESPLLIGLNDQNKKQQNTLYSYVRFLKRQQRLLENTRLLYVACTRAARRLYLFTGVQEHAQTGDLLPAGSTGLASCIWPALSNNIMLLDAAAAGPETKPEINISHLIRVKNVAPLPLVQESKLLTAEEEPARNRPPTAQSNRLERAVGMVVHKNLEQLIRDQRHGWVVEALDAKEIRWQTQLRQLGIGSNDLEKALGFVRLAVHNAITDASADWIFDATHVESAVELPVAIDTEKGIFHYVVDRTFVLADGTRWVIDYKTVFRDSCNDFAESNEEQVRFYREQLHNYARAFRIAGETALRMGLYFPLQQRFIEVS